MNTAAEDRLKAELAELTELPAGMGRAYATGKSEQPMVIFEMLPSPELDLHSPAIFEVTIGINWPGRPPRAVLTQGKPPAGSGRALVLQQPVEHPILREDEGWSRSYSLAVVYHSLRLLFKPAGMPDSHWDAAKDPWSPKPEVGMPSGLQFGLLVGHAGEQGRRRTMEDAVLIKQGLSAPRMYSNSCAVVGIFDGHAGDECAKYAAGALPDAVLRQLGRNGCSGWCEALSRAFLEVDGGFCGDPGLANGGSGCTALALVFDGKDRLVLGNLGDCRAVLASKSSSASSSSSPPCERDLTFDCRADRPDEVARIVSRGGFVNNKRVIGQLAVSRALGDAEYKRPRALVSGCPEITETRLSPSDDFLLLACDGLWDVMTSAEACAFVRAQLAPLRQGGGGAWPPSEGALSAVAGALVRHAIEDRKSTDNVSAVLALVVDPDLDGGRARQQPAGTGAGGGRGAQHQEAYGGAHGGPNAGPGSVPVPAPSSAAATAGSSERAAGAGKVRRAQIGGGDENEDFNSSMNHLGLHEPAAAAAKQQAAKARGDSVDTDEDLMEFLMDDNNFKF